MSITWKRPAIEKLIELIKHHECTWKVAASSDDSNDFQDIAFEMIAEQMQAQISGITGQDIKNQWLLMLQEFDDELREIQRRKKSRRVHVLRLWYYDKLLFLNRQLKEVKKESAESPGNEPLIEDAVDPSPQSVLPPLEVYIQEDEEFIDIKESEHSEDIQQVLVAEQKPKVFKRKHQKQSNSCEDTDDDSTHSSSASSTASSSASSTASSSASSDCSSNKAKRKPKKTIKYDWLGGFVVSQMDLIKPKYHATVAWELQCLMRKYVEKSEKT